MTALHPIYVYALTNPENVLSEWRIDDVNHVAERNERKSELRRDNVNYSSIEQEHTRLVLS